VRKEKSAMEYIRRDREGEISVLTLARGKVNAIDPALVRELHATIDDLRADPSVRALVLTGHGSFFSFGLDVPALYPLSREECSLFLSGFTGLYRALYAFPKPVVAALNGHTIAGGCMLAIACDTRLMAQGKGKISLNEITFGASVFAGSVEMLRACVGGRGAERILLSGAMFAPEEALALGLVDRVVAPEQLLPDAVEEARTLGAHDREAFASIKNLLRGPVVRVMEAREEESIRGFIRIWYSEATRKQLRNITIRE
jgi:enoyl-CoA hydratase/carnithine racemase